MGAHSAGRARFGGAAIASAVLTTLTFAGLVQLSFADRTSAAKSSDQALNLYVDPVTGSDSGPGTAAAPFRTINAALDQVAPGAVVHLSPGSYQENVTTKINGTAAAPITIAGPENGASVSGRYQAVLYGSTHAFDISNSYYVLRGFTIDGQQTLDAADPISTWPQDIVGIGAWKQSVSDDVRNDRLIYVDSGSTSRAVTGITIDDMFLHGAGGECIRLREDTTDTVVENSVVEYCGLAGRKNGNAYVFHNGEGIYIGTSPKDSTLANHDDDATSGIRVLDNVIRTFGSECVDIKENSHADLVEGNQCVGNAEPESFTGSDIEIRGYDNMILDNTIADSLGYGVKMGSDAAKYPNSGNIVRANRIFDTVGSAVLVERPEAGTVDCANQVGFLAAVTEQPDPTEACGTSRNPGTLPNG